MEYSTGIADDRFAWRDVPSYDCARADDCTRTDLYARQNGCAGTDESKFAHSHFTGKRCTRPDVHALGNQAIVINGSAGVDYHTFTEPRTRTHGAHREDLAAGSYRSRTGDERTWVYDCKRRVASMVEPEEAIQPILTMRSANSNACANMAMIAILLFPCGESGFAVIERHVVERRWDISIVKQSHQFRVTSRQRVAQDFGLSSGAPEHDRNHRDTPNA